jgi:hypothetical protein
MLAPGPRPSLLLAQARPARSARTAAGDARPDRPSLWHRPLYPPSRFPSRAGATHPVPLSRAHKQPRSSRPWARRCPASTVLRLPGRDPSMLAARSFLPYLGPGHSTRGRTNWLRQAGILRNEDRGQLRDPVQALIDPLDNQSAAVIGQRDSAIALKSMPKYTLVDETGPSALPPATALRVPTGVPGTVDWTPRRGTRSGGLWRCSGENNVHPVVGRVVAAGREPRRAAVAVDAVAATDRR